MSPERTKLIKQLRPVKRRLLKLCGERLKHYPYVINFMLGDDPEPFICHQDNTVISIQYYPPPENEPAKGANLFVLQHYPKLKDLLERRGLVLDDKMTDEDLEQILAD